MATIDALPERIVRLVSSDGRSFEVPCDVIESQSVTIQNMLEDVGYDEPINLMNVSGTTLDSVLEYCRHRHAKALADAAATAAAAAAAAAALAHHMWYYSTVLYL